MESERKAAFGPAVLAIVVSLAGCGGSSSTLAVNLSGNYTGSFQDRAVHSTPLSLTLTQTGTSLSGPWSGGLVDPPNGGPYANGGDIEGSVTGSAVSIFLMPVPYNEVGYVLTGNASGNTIVGTFTVAGFGGGTFTLTKR